MELRKAIQIAEDHKRLLIPHCVRVETAGSIRRLRQQVKYIELVCIPKTVCIDDGFFDKKEIRNPEFISLVNSFQRTKGNGAGKYTQIVLPGETVIDLFITTPEQWGLILMLRTGSSIFSRRMVTEIKKNGFMSESGFLKKYSGEIIPCYEEIDFFRITGMQYFEPPLRVF